MRSVPGLPLLLAAERLLTGCHLSVDVVLGDVAVTQGRSYWACAVDPASYLVKVGVGLESKLQESFQGAPDVISPRSGLSGRDGGLGTWVGELGTGRGCARGGHTCWDGAGRRLGGSNKSQAVGVAVVWRNVGSVKELCGLIFRVAGERDSSKGSHLHFPPSVTQAKTPSLQVSVSFLPNTPFPTSFLHKAFSLQYLLHPHLFSTS